MIVAAVLGAILVAFAILLAFKGIARQRFCVLCVSVSGTWLALLGMHWAGLFDDPVLLALLMGQSIMGLHYLLERVVDEALLIFRLPFVLTLTLLFYALVALDRNLALAAAVVVTSWVVAGAVYASRHAQGLRGVARQLIECCKNW